MKEDIQVLLKDILNELGITGIEPVVEMSDDPKHGEYTTNIAMRLKGSDLEHLKGLTLMGKSPMEIALWVAEKIKDQKSQIKSKIGDQKIEKTDQKISIQIPAKSSLQDIDRVEVVPPGFINFFLTEAKLSTSTNSVLRDEESYGKSQTDRGKKLMVEYTDPNPFKELHIGHLYSNAVGESLARIYEANGWKVKRADYFGDVGMHVAKSIWGLRKKMTEDKVTLKDFDKKSLAERVQYLGQAYAVGASLYEENTPAAGKAKEEMKDMNYMVYLAAQEYMERELGWVPQVDYRQYVNVSDQLYREIKLLFETGRKWSMDYFEGIFRRLGTKFDYYYPESVVGEYGAKLVREHIGDVFEKSDGAVIYRGEKDGLHTRVFMNALGLPTYEAKELGLNWKKFQDYSPDLSLIVTGNEINEYFKVLFAVMRQIIPEVAAKTRHIGHGMVRLPEGKMSSRTGKIITGEGLIAEVKRLIYEILKQNESKYEKKDQEEIAEKASIAAIKYSMLKVSLPANITFDFKKSLSFDGDSGPYLLYTYARCKSVLRKAQISDIRYQISSKINSEEYIVARLIHFFPEIVAAAASELAPNVLCSYLFKLAAAFNFFYQKHAILGNEARLALTAATAQVLRNGLYLLGIETVERM